MAPARWCKSDVRMQDVFHAGSDRVALFAMEYHPTGDPGDRRRWIAPDVRVPFLFSDYRDGSIELCCAR